MDSRYGVRSRSTIARKRSCLSISGDHIKACSKRPVGAVASAGNLSEKLGMFSAAMIALERRVDKLEKTVEDVQLKLDGVNNHVSSLVLWKSNNTLSSMGGDGGAHKQIGEVVRRLQTLEESAQRASLVHGSNPFDANALEAQVSRLTASLESVLARLDRHEQTNAEGVFIWKIDNFRRKKREAVDGVRREVYSAPFYSHRFGYKMCACLYPNGSDTDHSEYLSVYFVLMEGEYDAILDFPFALRVKFTLMDQDSHLHDLSSTIKPDPESIGVQRPTQAYNFGIGSPNFVSHSIAEAPTYLKNNCIYLRIAVVRD